jgi:hypothetical protein
MGAEGVRSLAPTSSEEHVLAHTLPPMPRCRRRRSKGLAPIVSAAGVEFIGASRGSPGGGEGVRLRR